MFRRRLPSRDYGFGTFVSIEADDSGKIVGVVFNSMLINPDYAGFGPRLSPASDLASFSPDFLNEQGSLLAIMLLGRFDSSEAASQGIPLPVIPAGQDVSLLSAGEFQAFHKDAEGRIVLGYFSQVVAHAGVFAHPLLEKVIDELSALNKSSDLDLKRLAVLRRSLVWQRTVGQMRL